MPAMVSKVPVWPCVKTIPLVFDDALSYVESLCALRSKLNEVIDALNDYEDDLKRYIDDKAAENLAIMQEQYDDFSTATDGKLSAMQTQIDGIESAVDTKISDLTEFVNASIQQQDAKLAYEISKLTAQVSAQISILYQRIAETLGQANAYTDLKIAELVASLPSLTTVYVLDPVSGKVVDIQTALNNMYDAFRYQALTAAQYDSLQLTAEEYDNREITALEYDRYGYDIFYSVLNALYTFSGNTGNRITYEQAFRELWQNQRVNGITAQSYDDLQLTADAFDAKQLTAYTYDWAGVSA